MRDKKLWLIFIIIFIMIGCKSMAKDNSNNQIDLSKLASLDNPVISPSGKYILILEEKTDGKLNYYIFKIQINDSTKKIIFTLDEKIFRKRDMNYICWDSSDWIWGYSGDVGVYYWSEMNMQWVKNVYLKEKQIQPPDILVKLRPNSFK